MAEASLYGLTSGDTKALYEEGVRKSFEEQGAVLGAYLSSTSKPRPYNSSTVSPVYPAGYSDDISEGNVSPSWDDTSGTADEVKEQQLQKIITQKYLALYPNSVEAWTEYRRTGYPFIMKPADRAAAGRIDAPADTRAPERFVFSDQSYTTNPSLKVVPSLLGGPDKGSTKLWWVRDNRPKQPNN